MGKAFERDGKRSLRFATFGAFDGAVSYVWYETCDRLIPDDPTRSDAVTTAMKVGVDAVAYNPIWGTFFIVVMGALSGKTLGGIKDDLKRDWLELYLSNVTFWVPMNFIIYGFTPVGVSRRRPVHANILYVCSLSMFQERKTLLKDSGETMNVADVVARALPDDARADWENVGGMSVRRGQRLHPVSAVSGRKRESSHRHRRERKDAHDRRVRGVRRREAHHVSRMYRAARRASGERRRVDAHVLKSSVLICTKF